MFHTSEVGRKIARLRKEKGHTQMELADCLGVSYQAVSNWERGNSMPDISKLPELAEFLECSIDELLCDGKESKLVEHIIKGDCSEYVKEEKVSVKEVADTAPILKPTQTEKLLDDILIDNKDKVSIKDIILIAPFVSEDYLDKIVNEIDVAEEAKGIIGLAPFLSKKMLDHLAKKIFENGKKKHIVGLAPFLSKETLQALTDEMMKTKDFKGLALLMPFLSK